MIDDPLICADLCLVASMPRADADSSGEHGEKERERQKETPDYHCTEVFQKGLLS